MHRILVSPIRHHFLEFGGHLAMQIPVHLRLRLVGNVHADLRLGTLGNGTTQNLGFGNQVLLALVRAPQQQMPLHGPGKRTNIGFWIIGILGDVVERSLRGICEMPVLFLRRHLRIHNIQ